MIDALRRLGQWDDTLFVVTSDHGQTKSGWHPVLAEESWSFPAVIHGPGVRKNHRIESADQIDIVPTLLDMLGVEGVDHFFGQSVFRQAPGEGRAFISNYQELGYLKNGMLTVLSPKQKIEAFTVDPVTLETTPAAVNPTLLKEAIAYYQTASRSFKQGALRIREPMTAGG